MIYQHHLNVLHLQQRFQSPEVTLIDLHKLNPFSDNMVMWIFP